MADTCVTFNFSSKIQEYSSTHLPPEWLKCERKSSIIAEKFIAFKTPLDDRFNPDVPRANRWTCKMLIEYVKNNQKNLGLVIDLTDTNRYYLSNTEFIEKNIRYEKIRCQEDDQIPSDEQINHFIQICNDFISTNPKDIIGVHCTYGFNQTGFLICAYLCQKLHYNIDNAIDLFAKARSPGINKQDYLYKLVQEFGKPAFQDPKPVFAVNLADVIPICSPPVLDSIRLKYQKMCEWNRQTFPGSKPVSMNKTNYETIFKSPYMVSWKADGTRYMMLINDQNQIYMLDRNNNVFQINNLRFPHYLDPLKDIKNTLIDGEFVIDKHNGKEIYRYLVYDIITYENENVSQKIFHDRLQLIRYYIVDVRNKTIENGSIDKSLEPFSIRIKDFWKLSETSYLLSPAFQSQITHGSDGLIFQPILDPYQFGRSSNVLKWDTNNTIDFRLKIDQIGQSQDKRALLYLHNMQNSFASMRYSSSLDQYDNQILECSYSKGRWDLYRSRPDKKYPNTQGTIQALKNPISKDVLCALIDEFLKFNNYQ